MSVSNRGSFVELGWDSNRENQSFKNYEYSFFLRTEHEEDLMLVEKKNDIDLGKILTLAVQSTD